MVAVHVRQEKQPRSGTLPYLPEVYGQRGVRDDFPVDRHDLRFQRSPSSCEASNGMTDAELLASFNFHELLKVAIVEMSCTVTGDLVMVRGLSVDSTRTRDGSSQQMFTIDRKTKHNAVKRHG